MLDASARVQGCRPSALALLLLVSLTCTANAAPGIVLIFSIQRHGARNILPKTPLLQESAADTIANLLPEGQRQCYNAGLAFAARYLNSSTCAPTCLAGAGQLYGVVGVDGPQFNSLNTLMRSSNLARTLLSAFSFFQGVFPPSFNNTNSSLLLPTGLQLVPLYSPDDVDDYTIRAYTKCPKYNNRLQNWYASAEYAVLKANTSGLRSYISSVQPSMDTSLPNWWNVYDAFNVWRTYGFPKNANLAPINESIYNQVQSLAYMLETTKMRSDFTENLLGGTILAEVLQRMAAAIQAITVQHTSEYYKLLSLSGHYPTQLAILGALKVDKSPAAASIAWLHTLPKPAAVMVFELWSDGAAGGGAQQFAVRLAAQTNGQTTPYVTIPLPCAVAGDAAEGIAGAGSCTWQSFNQTVSAAAITSVGAWCDACKNTEMSACRAWAMSKSNALLVKEVKRLDAAS